MEEKCYSEEDLIDPALYELSKYEKGLTTGQLIKILTEVLDPTGEDLKILFGRKDTRFSQKVRNLISHRTICPEFSDYNSSSSLLKINERGRKRLLESQYFLQMQESFNQSYEFDFDGDEDLTYSIDLSDYEEKDKKYIDYEQLNYSVFDLKRRFDKRKEGSSTGSLILDDSFQRNNVWSTKQKSQLIESLLLGIPIPYLYLYEDKNANLIVIDGRQRLTAVFDFLENKYALSKMEFLKFLNGKTIEKFKKVQMKNI